MLELAGWACGYPMKLYLYNTCIILVVGFSFVSAGVCFVFLFDCKTGPRISAVWIHHFIDKQLDSVFDLKSFDNRRVKTYSTPNGSRSGERQAQHLAEKPH